MNEQDTLALLLFIVMPQCRFKKPCNANARRTQI